MSEVLREGSLPCSPSYVCFPVPAVAVALLSSRGLASKVSTSVGTGEAGAVPGASGSLSYLSEAGAQHPQELGQGCSNGGRQGVRRVAKLRGPTLSSREKPEKLLWLSSHPLSSSEVCHVHLWVLGSPYSSMGRGSSSLPGGHLLPRELWIEKSITGMTVSDNT